MKQQQSTIYWPPEQAEAGVREAAAVLANGGIVAFPTETVYGLGADARSSSAVEGIFAAKGRPSDNPLIVHLADAEAAAALAERLSPLERKLMDAFWPGPLTVVVPVRAGAVSPRVTAGLDTVGVRVPDHELARKLIAASGCPIAAPSANRSGRPSPTTARHVLEDLDGRIDGVLDGGATGVGLESTVVRVLDGAVHILRPGGITAEQLKKAVGDQGRVLSESDGEAAASATGAQSPSEAIAAGGAAAGKPSAPEEEAPRSPGVKYAHYAPKGVMVLVSGDPQRLPAAVQAAADEQRARGSRVGILACAENADAYRADAVLSLGLRSEPEQAAHALYAALRECDDRDISYIVAEAFPEAGIGAALRNRMLKAAGGRVIQA
ncbi:L-threonylcarbamoyladenylate synthase [Cohnella sp. AR92]|uniref:L-threonylcarbamoyladenylate synthase n=1 Tax=Cohnella sp. AR92 TaxID=648716 RepID=UPI000F8CCEBD|nr:L-threonylcarbamoyladenylate synthase [Cohnella sp. AR92]RUS49150.1 threonylcarbamoyl-AMP synthase [Cohnella sp. AR92]